MIRVTVSAPSGAAIQAKADGDYTPEAVEDLTRRLVDQALRFEMQDIEEP
jgi:hypothetical protein